MEIVVSLLDKMEKYPDAMRTAGRRAIEQAKRAGVPAYYVDPALGDGIIKECRTVLVSAFSLRAMKT